MAAAPGTGSGLPLPGNNSREAGWLARVENGFEWFLSLARVLVLVPVIILVAGVSFVEVVLNFHNGLDTLYLGASVALVIAALTVFLRFGSQDHRDR